MGFLPVSLGVMLLYDLQIALSHGGGKAYAIVDIFPDLLAFALILWGLLRLSKRDYDCKKEILAAAFMAVVSLLDLFKRTLLYDRFYTDVTETAAGQCVFASRHLLILGFLVLLFRKTASVLIDRDETSLARVHARVTPFAIMEGVVFLLSFILGLVRREGFLESGYRVAKMLDMILWIFLVWYGGIAQLRASLKTA